MPTILPPATILVSGANGFIAVWLVKVLLEKGYSVRGAVRSESKIDHLKKLFKSYVDEGKLTFVIVPDMTAKGAFDEAVKGVDAIAHTASPVNANVEDPKDIIDPAVKGTVGILESALAHGSSTVQRIVITSSAAAILSLHSTPRLFTEADWNDQAVEAVEKEGKQAGSLVKYWASKVLAERAAWKIWEDHKKEVKWDVVALHPPFIFGPILHEVASPDQLGSDVKLSSMSFFYNAVIRSDSGGMSTEQLTASLGSWVDVRDAALGHALAFQKEEAGGERIMISTESRSWQDFIDAANALGTSRPLPKGAPGKGAKEHLMLFDSSKEAKILGLKKHTMEETTRDILADFEAKGW